jgi:hypothetical protein
MRLPIPILLLILLLAILTALLSGCATSYVGLRGGVGMAPGSMEFSGPVSNEGSGLGSQIGMTSAVGLSEVIFIQFDPNVHTMRGSADVAYTYQSGEFYRFAGEIDVTATSIDIPVSIAFRKSIGNGWAPFVGVGGVFGITTSTTKRLSGTLTAETGPEQGRSAELSPVKVSSTMADAQLAVQAFAGADYDLSADWVLRPEVRLQQYIVTDRLGGFTIGEDYRTAGFVSISTPQTTLAVTLSLMLRL